MQARALTALGALAIQACTDRAGHDRRPDPTTFDSTGTVPGDSSSTGETGASDTGTGLPGCDLPPLPIPPVGLSVAASIVRTTRIFGDPCSLLGNALVTVAQSAGPATLVVGAPGEARPCTETDGEYPNAALWVYGGPLAPGDLGRVDAQAVAWGDPDLIDQSAIVLAVGDLTGDGRADVVTGGGVSARDTPFYVVDPSTLAGEVFLEDVASALIRRVPLWGQAGEVSVQDWNADGSPDLAFGVWKGGLGGAAGLYDAAEVFAGPFAGESTMGTPPDDGATAWFEVGANDYGAAPSGYNSVLIPDVDGDGAAELLASGNGWQLVPFQGAVSWAAGGFALFGGNVAGGYDLDAARATFHAPCDPDPQVPIPIGDVTGDGRPDVGVVGWGAYIDGDARGALFVLSRLHEAAGLMTLTMVSDAVIYGHGYDMFGSADGMLTDAVGLGDLDGDGQDDDPTRYFDPHDVWLFFKNHPRVAR